MLILWLLLLLSIGVLLCIIGLVIFGVAGFCTLVGKLFVLVEQKTEQWSQACQRAAVSFLPQPPTPGEQYSFSVQMDILFSRLFNLALVSLFIAGEVYNMLLALPALSHQPPSLPPLPGLFDLAASALFMIPPALFGIVLLEAAGFVLFREGLFPTGLSLWRRVALSLYAAVSLVISIMVISASWQFRAVYLDPVARQAIDPTALSAMAEYVLHGLGLLAGLSSLLIIQAFRIGWGCVIAVFLYLMSLGFSCVSFLTQLAARLSEGISLYCSHNTLSPYDLPPDPVKQTRQDWQGKVAQLLQERSRLEQEARQTHQEQSRLRAELANLRQEHDTLVKQYNELKQRAPASNTAADSADPKEYFKTLGLHPLCAQILSEEQFQKLLNYMYRLFSQVYHPDHHTGDTEQMKKLNLARDFLRDAQNRRDYAK